MDRILGFLVDARRAARARGRADLVGRGRCGLAGPTELEEPGQGGLERAGRARPAARDRRRRPFHARTVDRRGVTAQADAPGGQLAAGERVLLVDPKERRYLVTLNPGAFFHTHSGIVAHDDVIGQPEGSTIGASTGRRFVVVRPTLADVVLKMPRGAQVIYPKDLGRHPASRPTSAPACGCSRPGSGRGRCRWRCCGPGPTWWATRCAPTSRRGHGPTCRRGRAPSRRTGWKSATSTRGSRSATSIVSCSTCPSRGACWALRPRRCAPAGSSSPTCRRSPRWPPCAPRWRPKSFGMAETFEILRRTWHVEERSVRPDHRMVAHTGFLTTARLLVAVVGGRRPEPQPKPVPTRRRSRV